MSKLEVKIKGIPALLNKLDAITQDKTIRKGLMEAASYVAGWVKIRRLSGPRPLYLQPVSNNLRASISAGQVIKRGRDYMIPIGTNVRALSGFNYPAYWEGVSPFNKGRKREPRPFLRPAIEDKQNREEVVDTIIENINTAIEKAK